MASPPLKCPLGDLAAWAEAAFDAAASALKGHFSFFFSRVISPGMSASRAAVRSRRALSGCAWSRIGSPTQGRGGARSGPPCECRRDPTSEIRLERLGAGELVGECGKIGLEPLPL
jgi:hypothetical protein